MGCLDLEVTGLVNAYSYSSAIVSSKTWQRSLCLWNEMRGFTKTNVVAMNASLRGIRKHTENKTNVKEREI